MLVTIYHILEYAFFIAVGILVFYSFISFSKVFKVKGLVIISIIAVMLLLLSSAFDMVISWRLQKTLPTENESNIITKIDTTFEPRNAMAKDLVRTINEENVEIITILQKEGSTKYYIQVTATDGDVFEFDFDTYQLFELLPRISFDKSPLVE